MQRKSMGHSRRKHGEQGRVGFEQPVPRVTRQARSGQFRRRAAERHNDRCAERRRYVHRAGIIGEQHAAEFSKAP